MHIVVKIKGEEIKLTLEQARELYEDLDEMFGRLREDNPITYPVAPVYPTYPIYPKPYPYDGTPHWPDYTPQIWCSVETQY